MDNVSMEMLSRHTQVPKNSNCEAQMDDYMYCL
jgi:hypothetical protein